MTSPDTAAKFAAFADMLAARKAQREQDKSRLAALRSDATSRYGLEANELAKKIRADIEARAIKWTPRANVLMGQWQTCACGHEAQATLGTYVLEYSQYNDHRLRATTSLMPRLPIQTHMDGVYMTHCVMCTGATILSQDLDALLQAALNGATTQPPSQRKLPL